MAASLQASSIVSQKFRVGPISKSSPGLKRSVLVVRSDARRRRNANLIANAVAEKSATSKPGHELLLFEALREGLEEEMERDP